ncbi:MAG TPA: ATP-dependent helicase [Aggregatilinea sp.]|uniref:ATP-dependent helicase n=1 Tax=Aggregatilinea sp. TaxID=2806333 RepID=UPI002C1198A5|nr:ATP-dependent helicase [Aggregatilinea sp.]HML20159.1 ATP-dependent helicase [Aggregatilinea sp.]
MTAAAAPGFRPEQEKIISGYTHGQIGVAAVPGSGKTFTLAHLAARLIATGRIETDQEILIVTFTNSAVNGFQARIAQILRQQYHLLPTVGYRVRTLHGLAHDIVRERPALVGLSDDFVILDERAVLEIQRDLTLQKLAPWRDALSSYVNAEEDSKFNFARRQFEQDLPGLVARFIQQAKDLQLDPERLADTLRRAGQEVPLARFATEIYADYQRSLTTRGAVDFDDLVRLALRALDTDGDFRRRLQDRWPYILEDEAQDSSQLQQEMLQQLSAGKNWVRVGDPNQAINTTFTTASSQFLLDFLDPRQTPGVEERPLSVSGRSALPIIDLANELVRWSVEEHPSPALRRAFSYAVDEARGIRRGSIQPAGNSGDPQPNPPIDACHIHIEYQPGQKITPDKELEMVVAGEEWSLVSWFKEIEALPPDERPTVAVLVPENSRGFKLAELLNKYQVPYKELLRSTTDTRRAVNLLRTVLEYLAEPVDLKALKQVFWLTLPPVYQELVHGDIDLRQTMTKLFNGYRNIEAFLWPVNDESDAPPAVDPGSYPWLPAELDIFRERMRRWLEATTLPVDQLVLTIGQDLFEKPVDIALTYKVAVLLKGIAHAYPDWRLPQFVDELRAIGSNERRFIGFDDAEEGYVPEPGVVTVATMHAAKGLEWDRVYLMSVSNYGFPSAQPYDTYLGERWYVRDNLNLEAELLTQIKALAEHELDQYVEGQATVQARVDYAAERLRLLYVGITRARRELIITWNMGRFWQKGNENQAALPLIALNEYLKAVRLKD